MPVCNLGTFTFCFISIVYLQHFYLQKYMALEHFVKGFYDLQTVEVMDKTDNIWVCANHNQSAV